MGATSDTAYEFRIPPKHINAGNRRFYDDGGNFHEDFCFSQRVVFSKEINRVLDKYISITINTNWDIVRSNLYVIQEMYPIGDRRSVPASDQFFWSVGHGFGRLLDKLSQSSEINPATHSQFVEAIGRFGTFADAKGKWDLSLDSAADNLIREAHFSPDGLGKATLSITNSGLLECADVKIAGSGVFDYYGYKALFEVKSFRTFDPATDSRFIEVRNDFNKPLPTGNSQVIDYCKNPAERISVRF